MPAVDFGHQEKLVDLGGSVSPMSVLGVFHRRTYGNWPTNWDMISQTADIRLLVGGFNPSEKYESQWEGLSHILWKIKDVPNHQPDYLGMN